MHRCLPLLSLCSILTYGEIRLLFGCGLLVKICLDLGQHFYEALGNERTKFAANGVLTKMGSCAVEDGVGLGSRRVEGIQNREARHRNKVRRVVRQHFV